METKGIINIKNRKYLSFEQIRRYAVIYISLPMLCFFCGFLRWYYGIICSATLLFILRIMLREKDGLDQEDSSPLMLPVKTIVLVFVLSLIWTYLGGMNGYYAQSSDWDCRNAVYFDLIKYDWPVRYSINGGALVYYFGHWLFPASLAKLAGVLSGSAAVSREVGRMLLWLWSSAGLSLVILMIFRVVNADTRGRRIAAAFLFVFFSGLDLAGALFRNSLNEMIQPSVLHLEWWAPNFQYTSITACVFWVFNQAIIPWMITLLFFMEKKPANYVYYCVVCLLCGTLPCVGLAALMIVKALIYGVSSWKRKKIRAFILSIFSIRNILSFLLLFPVIASFILSANTATALNGRTASSVPVLTVQQKEEETGQEDLTGIQTLEEGNRDQESHNKEAQPTETTVSFFSARYLTWKLLAFLFLEVGLYMLLIWADHRKDPLYYAMAVCFFLIPCIHVGKSNDFCMRASIPGVFILMLYVNRFLLDHFSLKRKQTGDKLRRALALLLALCFVIGMATPLVELYRGAYQVIDRGTFFLENQTLMTFDQERINNNFLCSFPEEHFFFRHFAKKQANEKTNTP